MRAHSALTDNDKARYLDLVTRSWEGFYARKEIDCKDKKMQRDMKLNAIEIHGRGVTVYLVVYLLSVHSSSVHSVLRLFDKS